MEACAKQVVDFSCKWLDNLQSLDDNVRDDYREKIKLLMYPFYDQLDNEMSGSSYDYSGDDYLSDNSYHYGSDYCASDFSDVDRHYYYD